MNDAQCSWQRVETHEHAGDFNRSPYLLFGAASFGTLEASFWKRGSLRSGSNIGSSRSIAGVSGTLSLGNAPAYGVESSCCKAAMARSGSRVCAVTRARISIRAGPLSSSSSPAHVAKEFALRTKVTMEDSANDEAAVAHFGWLLV
jgi:hypothetical protein